MLRMALLLYAEMLRAAPMTLNAELEPVAMIVEHRTLVLNVYAELDTLVTLLSADLRYVRMMTDASAVRQYLLYKRPACLSTLTTQSASQAALRSLLYAVTPRQADWRAKTRNDRRAQGSQKTPALHVPFPRRQQLFRQHVRRAALTPQMEAVTCASILQLRLRWRLLGCSAETGPCASTQ